MRNVVLAVLSVLLATGAVAQQAINPVNVLEDVSVAVCGVEDGKNQGRLTAASFDAAAELRLKGILKSVADAGVEAAASYNTTDYVNGLASDNLAGELKSIRDCKLRVFQDFSPVIVSWMSQAKAGGQTGVTQSNTGDCGTNIAGVQGNTSVTVNCNANN